MTTLTRPASDRRYRAGTGLRRALTLRWRGVVERLVRVAVVFAAVLGSGSTPASIADSSRCAIDFPQTEADALVALARLAAEPAHDGPSPIGEADRDALQQLLTDIAALHAEERTVGEADRARPQRERDARAQLALSLGPLIDGGFAAGAAADAAPVNAAGAAPMASTVPGTASMAELVARLAADRAELTALAQRRNRLEAEVGTESPWIPERAAPEPGQHLRSRGPAGDPDSDLRPATACRRSIELLGAELARRRREHLERRAGFPQRELATLDLELTAKNRCITQLERTVAAATASQQGRLARARSEAIAAAGDAHRVAAAAPPLARAALQWRAATADLQARTADLRFDLARLRQELPVGDALSNARGRFQDLQRRFELSRGVGADTGSLLRRGLLRVKAERARFLATGFGELRRERNRVALELEHAEAALLDLDETWQEAVALADQSAAGLAGAATGLQPERPIGSATDWEGLRAQRREVLRGLLDVARSLNDAYLSHLESLIELRAALNGEQRWLEHRSLWLREAALGAWHGAPRRLGLALALFAGWAWRRRVQAAMTGARRAWLPTAALTAWMVAAAVLLVDLAGLVNLAHWLVRSVLGSLVTLVAIGWALSHALARLATASPDPTPDPLRTARRGFLIAQGRLYVCLGAVVLAVLGVGIALGWQWSDLWLAAAGPGTAGSSPFDSIFYRVVAAILLFTFAQIALRALRGLLDLYVLVWLGVERSLRYSITTVLHYAVVIALAAVIGFGILGVRMEDMQWLLAAAGVGLGFGLQEVVSNFVSGIIILLERPLKVGDVVSFDGEVGEVVSVNIRSTTVRTFANHFILVPNKEIISQRLLNFTGSDPAVRISVPIGVAYGTDVTLVRRLLLEAATGHRAVLHRPPPDCLFRSHGESSLDFELRMWVDVRATAEVQSDVRAGIDAAFREHGISVPFPQREITVRTVSAEATLPGQSTAPPPPPSNDEHLPDRPAA